MPYAAQPHPHTNAPSHPYTDGCTVANAHSHAYTVAHAYTNTPA